MMQRRIACTIPFTLLLAFASVVEAGPPLICIPFETGSTRLLPWGDGPGWNSPDRRYEVRHLTRDTLRLLTPDAPVLERMENLRRATIYAGGDSRIAGELLAALMARADASADAATLFDAGYLVESYKQFAFIQPGAAPAIDGYALVKRAIAMSGAVEMEYAASLMSQGDAAAAHRRRAQAAAPRGSLLARNLEK